MINASIGSLPDGSVGCDSASPLNSASAKQYYNNKYRFIVRYVGRGDGSKTYVDLTPGEGQAIIDAGLALGVVQHPLREGWKPTGDLGTSFGAAAASLSGEAGLPFGVTVWLDLEGVAAGTPAQNVIDYCNNWYAEVAAVGYVPGLYVGANPGLTADQLYWDLHMASYWRGGSSEAAGVPSDIPHRGYQMVQRITGAGTAEFDFDTIKTDRFGGAVQWCVAPPLS
jgi:hypothetical protein